MSNTPDVVDLGGSDGGEDPTKVLFRRYLAYLVDFLLLLALGIVVLSTQAESNSIAAFNDRLEAVATENGTTFTPIDSNDLKRFDEEDGTYTIFTRDFPVAADNIIIVEQKDLQYAAFAVLAAWVLMFVGLQGFTGATIGKAAAGLRAVKRDGSPPGIVRALGRSIFLPIDSLPSAPFLPLVGTISAVASKGNRRLGDFVGGTYVIDKDAKGQPVVVGGGRPEVPDELPPEQPAAAAAAVPAWPAGGEPVAAGQAPAAAAASTTPAWAQAPDPTGQTPAWAAASGQPAPSDQIDWTSEQPLPGGMGEDPRAPGADGGAAGAGTAPSDWEAAIAAENLPEEPAASPGASAAAAATAAVAGASAAGSTSAAGPTIDDYEPQWDEARGSYIQWDPRRDEWLQFSEALKTWHPIDRPPSP